MTSKTMLRKRLEQMTIKSLSGDSWSIVHVKVNLLLHADLSVHETKTAFSLDFRIGHKQSTCCAQHEQRAA
jgi:hypothetical protein